MGKEPERGKVLLEIVFLHVSHFAGDRDFGALACSSGIQDLCVMPIRNKTGSKILQPERLHSAPGEIKIAKGGLYKEDFHCRVQGFLAKTRVWFRQNRMVR